MALLELQSLCKFFFRGQEKISALRDVTVAINEGEFVAITGSSGSGKSTLLHILGLLDKQSSGNYFFDGISTELLNESELAKLRNQKLGFVFQRFHLLPQATAIRNVMMPLLYASSYREGLNRSQSVDISKAALHRVGLSARLNHKPNELSGGECQRVAIARALVNKPQLLFADEPTGNLDSHTGSSILELFKELNSAGITIVMITHDEKVANMAKRRIVLQDGQVISDSTKGGLHNVNA